ncbi:DNA-directed RNA polymerase II subunit I [Hyaloraphidium curvatum]|nr:DNA-directed RNA polymerase II subunit I [Hyaloraphidium curvatum]
MSGTGIAIKFCSECNNLLYPKEEKSEDGDSYLAYSCRHCSHSEPGDPAVPIHRALVAQQAAEATLVMTDLASDPTLPRTTLEECGKCHGYDAVFFLSGARKKGDSDMRLYYACANKSCGNRWVKTVDGA